MELRTARREELRAWAAHLFEPIDPTRHLAALTVLENLIFGRLSLDAGAEAEKVRELVAEMLEAEGLKGEVALLVGDLVVGPGGAEPDAAAEARVAFTRALIPRPDLLVLGCGSTGEAATGGAPTRRLRQLLPEATIVVMAAEFEDLGDYDVYVEIESGRVAGFQRTQEETAPSARADLDAKLRALERASVLRELDRRQLRLFASASQWFEAKAGERIFRRGERADGAYVLTSGRAAIRWPEAPKNAAPITWVEPYRLIGDLAVILGTERAVDLVAETPSRGLRIGAREQMEVIANDAGAAASLLKAVAENLARSSRRLDLALRELPPEAQSRLREIPVDAQA